jgi:FkbM family methyltransferase
VNDYSVLSLMKLILFAIIVSHVCCDPQSMLAGLKLAQNKPGIVVDVGANGGGETNMALQHNRAVFAVECLAQAYNYLLDMFVDTKNVTLIHACAGGKTEVKILNLADDSSSLIRKNVASGMELQKARRIHNKRRHNIEHVIVVPLDNLVTTPVALMKIDVQGFEGDVLRGAQQISAQPLSRGPALPAPSQQPRASYAVGGCVAILHRTAFAIGAAPPGRWRVPGGTGAPWVVYRTPDGTHACTHSARVTCESLQ